MHKHLFNERKAAEAAAYFLMRAGGSLAILKLTKLLYLAERRSYEKFGEGMVGDQLVSMPHGPVLSLTYNHMNGVIDSVPGGWDTWITDRAGHQLSLQDASRSPDDLLELSDADLEVLTETWAKFGAMSGSALRNYTHNQCPEWKDPDGSMIPMTPESLFDALGFTEAQKRAALGKLAAASSITAAFAENT
jgi:uncharacterized phage-associated protein